MRWEIREGDALAVLRTMESASFDAVLCDPPYGLSFMGKAWDHGVPSVEVWAEVLRVLKPGAFMLAFGGTRTFHRLTCAIEDAGFEIRDCVSWVYATGFPKSHNFGCRCAGGTEPYAHGEPAPQHNVRPLRETYLPQAIHASDQCGEAMQQSVSEQDASKHGPERTESRDARGTESGLEGRRHLQAEQGELSGTEVCPMPRGVHGDGEEGRLCHGAPAGDGDAVGTMPSEGRSGASRGSRHQEQRAGEPGIMAGQSKSQGGRSEATCPRCGKPTSFVGYGTALKPAWEPCIVAMKPLDGTFAENALEHGVAGLNIEAGRVGTTVETWPKSRSYAPGQIQPGGKGETQETGDTPFGRWSANLILDAEAGAMLDAQSGKSPSHFFYSAKTSRKERDAGLDAFKARSERQASGRQSGRSFVDGAWVETGSDPLPVRNTHPCLKPLDLNRYLANLILPPKRDTPRRILVPFSGSGSEMIGALLAGWDEAVGIEREADYCAIAEARLKFWTQPGAWEQEQAQRVADDETFDDLPLFRACAPD